MKISEIMTSEVITVGEYMPVTEVAKIVSENKIHAVPVVDSENKVLGIITETDFFTKQIIDVGEARRLASNPDALNLALRGISNSDNRLR